MSIKTSEPLSKPEIERLQMLLHSYSQVMDLEMLDGFLTALVCSPRAVPPGQFMPLILGSDTPIEDKAAAKEFLDLILRHWNATAETLHAGKPRDMVMLAGYDDVAYGNAWAFGFMIGTDPCGQYWVQLFQDQDHRDLMQPIVRLAFENSQDPALRSEPIAPSERENILASIAEGLPKIYSYFMPKRQELAGSGAPLRPSIIIGRNDPCPCGSGKKYKACCGA